MVTSRLTPTLLNVVPVTQIARLALVQAIYHVRLDRIITLVQKLVFESVLLGGTIEEMVMLTVISVIVIVLHALETSSRIVKPARHQIVLYRVLQDYASV